ncbi:M24 family metallopeptidase [Desulfocicer niacini]
MSELNKCTQTESLNPKFPYMPKGEWEGRIKQAGNLMKKAGVDALLVLNKKNQVYYFGSVKPYPYVFPAAGIVTADGQSSIFSDTIGCGNFILKGYASRAVYFVGDSRAPTQYSPVPVDALADLIKDMGLEKATIGVEKGDFGWWSNNFTLNEWEQLNALLPDVKWVDSMDDIIWPQRKIKTKWEQDVIRELMDATAKGYMKGMDRAMPGVTEKEVFYAMMEEWLKLGIIDSIYEMNVLQTSRGATSFYEDHVLQLGDYVFTDGGPSYKEYMSDMQRQFWIGSPSFLEEKYPGFRKMAQAAEIVHMEIEEYLRPGVSMGELYKRGTELLVDRIGDHYWDQIHHKNFIGWLGHCQGLYYHEPPYVVENETAELEPGMVVCLELPAMNIEKMVVYNMPENVYLITEDGFESLNDSFGPSGPYYKY